MIKSFTVVGLHSQPDHEVSLKLNEDLNILTGRNGSGKTTLLKLMWYMISPNVERAISEVAFRRAQVQTSEFSLEIERDSSKTHPVIRITYAESRKKSLEIEIPQGLPEPIGLERVEDVNARIDQLPGGSVFFPTFRRIEGGYSIDRQRRTSRLARPGMNDISGAIAAYADSISVHRHRFVASVSTDDVELLLTEQYADVSEQANNLHLELSRFISENVPKAPRKPSRGERVDVEELLAALKLLDGIREKLAKVDQKRAGLMRPFDILSNLIAEFFKDKGITVASNLTFGEVKEAIRASVLSAGEKQMLSFLSYNAFVENTPIFIDEPELSLHGDWQRRLFPTLLGQGTTNQFIVSTHSPFIYAKYPEKELVLDTDKGE